MYCRSLFQYKLRKERALCGTGSSVWNLLKVGRARTWMLQTAGHNYSYNCWIQAAGVVYERLEDHLVERLAAGPVQGSAEGLVAALAVEGAPVEEAVLGEGRHTFELTRTACCSKALHEKAFMRRHSAPFEQLKTFLTSSLLQTTWGWCPDTVGCFSRTIYCTALSYITNPGTHTNDRFPSSTSSIQKPENHTSCEVDGVRLACK